jgi:hypothetical protein
VAHPSIISPANFVYLETRLWLADGVINDIVFLSEAAATQHAYYVVISIFPANSFKKRCGRSKDSVWFPYTELTSFVTLGKFLILLGLCNF